MPPLNFSKWVKCIESEAQPILPTGLKQSYADYRSSASSKVLPSDLNSDLDESLELRIDRLKSENNEILRILKNQ